MLDLFDGGYHSPRHDLPLPNGWWVDPRVRALQAEIKALLRQQMAGGKPFGFKDPRSARLLPMWRQIFRSLDLAPKFVLCLRNPAQVARSLTVRDELDAELDGYCWLVYMTDILSELRNTEICLVEYEYRFPNPALSPTKLQAFLGVRGNRLPTT
jgi:hypothetical protein